MMMVVEEERVSADEGPAMPAGAGDARPDRCMGEARAAEGGTADMGKVCAADMHAAAEATGTHATATEVATTTHAATVTATSAATTSGEHW
jgi:hypothetical protein